MKINPAALKSLAQKIGSTPEWTGPNGVFISQYSGYMGVRIFAEYTKELRVTNRNQIPETLQHRNYDYIDYLEAKSDDYKKTHEQFYKHTVPKIREMVRLGNMTKDSILAFANIFNDLGIGLVENITVADYQSAVSQAIGLKSGNSQGDDQTTDNSTKQNYQMMVLSDKEKQEVIEKCRQKGVLISERDLDYMYYGSSDGCLYYGNGSPVTQAAIGVAIAETLQYQVEKGDAEKLNMSQAEIEKVLATCNRLGVPMNKEELENMYLDKDGNIYGNDGTPIKDTILVTAITQTDTFAAKYAKMADRRAKMPIKKAADISPSYVDPAKLPEPVVIPTEGFSMSALPGIPSDSSDGSGVSSMTPVSDRASAGISISGSGGTSDRDESRLESIFGGQKPTIQKEFAGIRNGKSKIVTNPRNGTRRRANSNRNGQNRKGQNGEGQSQGDQGGQGEDNQDQPEPNKRDSNNGTSKGENPGGYNGETFPEQQPEEGMSIPGKVAVGAGVCTAVGVGKAVYAATFFLPLQVIDNHSFISSILKILFQ